MAFRPSGVDEATPLQALTVWVRELTEPAQARDIWQPSNPGSLLVIYLNVDDIRDARPDPDCPDVPYLDVVWHPQYVEQGDKVVLDERPGATGHAGITGLVKRPGLANASKLYKSLREELTRRVLKTEILR